MGEDLKAFSMHISRDYTPLYEPGRESYAEFAFWVRPDGTVQHALCVRNHQCSMALIQTVVEELEAWRFPPDLGAQATLMGQRIRFLNTFVDNIDLL